MAFWSAERMPRSGVGMFLHFPSDPLRRTKAITTGIVAIGGVIMLAAWLVAGLSIVAERETAIDHARSEVGNLTAALADEVTHALDNVTAAMEIVAQRMRAAPRALDIHDWAREIRLLQETTIPGSIVGPDGRLVSTTLNPSPEPIDLSDREYFRAHLDENVHGIFISKPVTDRTSHQVTFPVSRRVDAADGRFLGVIVFSLSPGDLTGLYKMVDLGKRGTIVLTGLDNIIRARFSRESPDGLDGLGESIAGGSRPATFAENASGLA